MIITVIGGSASGKSKIAEDLICSLSGSQKKYYIATMKVGEDEENIERVKKHRFLRKDKGFETIEAPVGIDKALDVIGSEKGKNVLIECMSNLVANEMFFDSMVVSKEETVKKVVDQISVLSKNADNVVIVTNNIFEDGREYDKYTTDYLEALSLINQKIIEMSDEAYEAVVGIPVRIKKVSG